MNKLIELGERPIIFNYPKPTLPELIELKQNDACVEIKEEFGFILGNDYYKMELPGSVPTIFCRKAVLLRLQKLKKQIWPHYGIYCFDVFRTKETQAYLFHEFQTRIKKAHPKFTQLELEMETLKYVSHPHNCKFTAPPHNTGGAIDLALVDLKSGRMLNHGSEIDLSEAISATDFFEQAFDPQFGLTETEWLEARKNRRILFHSMVKLGFTNYHTEWWHYDLGDGMWAEALGEEALFHSMEEVVQHRLHKEKI